MNQLTIIGNLGADPETKTFPDGNAITTLRIATTEKWTSKDGTAQERTEWHRVVVRGRDAQEVARRLHKGDRVLVNGSVQSREYEKDGAKVRITEVAARGVFVEISAPREQRNAGPARSNGGARPAQGGNDYADDIPF